MTLKICYMNKLYGIKQYIIKIKLVLVKNQYKLTQNIN